MSAVVVAQSWVLGTAGAGSLAVAGGRVAAYRQRAEPTRAYLAVGLGAVGIALVLNVAPLGTAFDRLLRTDNLSVLLSQVLALVDAWAAIEMVSASVERRSRLARAARAVLFLGAASVLAWTFAGAPAWAEWPVVQLFVDTSHLPGWQTYWMTYAVVSLVPSVYLAGSSLRHAGHAIPWLRRGLVLVGAGALLCAAFNVLLIIALLGTATLTLGFLQITTVALGCTLVALGVGLPHLPDAFDRRRVRPVWSALVALYPEVRASRQPDLRRMVTEVHDAVVVARTRDELASPLVCAVAELPARTADDFETAIADLVAVSKRRLSPEWDDELWAAGSATPS